MAADGRTTGDDVVVAAAVGCDASLDGKSDAVVADDHPLKSPSFVAVADRPLIVVVVNDLIAVIDLTANHWSTGQTRGPVFADFSLSQTYVSAVSAFETGFVVAVVVVVVTAEYRSVLPVLPVLLSIVVVVCAALSLVKSQMMHRLCCRCSAIRNNRSPEGVVVMMTMKTMEASMSLSMKKWND